MDKGFDYETLFEKHYQSAVHYANSFLYDTEEARDVVGDVLLRMLEIEDRLKLELNVPGLFYSMVCRKCLDIVRRRQRLEDAKDYMKQTADRISDDELASLCQKELFRIIGQTVYHLPWTERVAFSEIRLEGRSYREVAESMNLTWRSVEYNVKKATEKVKERLRYLYG